MRLITSTGSPVCRGWRALGPPFPFIKASLTGEPAVSKRQGEKTRLCFLVLPNHDPGRRARPNQARDVVETQRGQVLLSRLPVAADAGGAPARHRAVGVPAEIPRLVLAGMTS